MHTIFGDIPLTESDRRYVTAPLGELCIGSNIGPLSRIDDGLISGSHTVPATKANAKQTLIAGTHPAKNHQGSISGEPSLSAMIYQLAKCLLLTALMAGMTSAVAADNVQAADQHPLADSPPKPRTFDKRITDRLGVKNVAYLLAVDVNGKVVPFVSDDPKATYRVIDPAREKLTMDLYDIEPFTIVAGKRNPFCVLYVGGSGRKLWMEACP